MGESKKSDSKTGTVDGAGVSRWRGWFVTIAAAAGLGVCLYLYSLHVALLMGELKSGPLCGADSGLGCQLAASSAYASLFGVPLAAWGAVFYAALALLGLGGVIFRRDQGSAYLRGAFLLAALGFAFNLYLAYVMVFRLQTVCWICVSTYLVNLVILIALATGVRAGPGPGVSLRFIFPAKGDTRGGDLYYRNVIKVLILGGISLAFAVGVAGDQFISSTLTKNDREQLTAALSSMLRQTPKRLEVAGRPAKGPENAHTTVVEYSDFRCPYCARAAQYLKLAESGTRQGVRFVFRHFPLDKSCNEKLTRNLHPGACLLAEASACANEQEKFWEYHDLAFETEGGISRSVVVDIASEIGLDLSAFEACLDSGRGLEVVKEDIAAAVKAGVNSTPTLFVNGRMLLGVPKPWMLEEIFQYSKTHLPPP